MADAIAAQHLPLQHLTSILQHLTSRLFPTFEFNSNPTLLFLIYITHDIDWLNPWHPYSVVKTFTHGKKWIAPKQLFNPNLFLKGIERLLQFNRKQQTNAIWLIGATNQHTFNRKGLRYKSTSLEYQTALSILIESAVEIGLHSVSSEPIITQCNHLSSSLNKPIRFHRSHYLNYTPEKLYPELVEAGIQVDFSLGQARSIAIPKRSPYPNLEQPPTVLFDNSFFFHPPETVLSTFKQVVITAKEQNTDVAILFHPENFCIFPELWNYYYEVLKIIQTEYEIVNPESTA